MRSETIATDKSPADYLKRVSIGVAEVADTMDAFESQPEESKGDTDHSVAVRGSLYYQS